jgi:hypothetical protein
VVTYSSNVNFVINYTPELFRGMILNLSKKPIILVVRARSFALFARKSLEYSLDIIVGNI